MNKKTGLGILFVFLSFIFVAGCDTIVKKGGGDTTEFKRGSSGLVMEFVRNYPGDGYIVNKDTPEDILIMIDLKNKGTYPDGDHFSKGKIYISGFDDEIVDITVKSKSLSDPDMFLAAASPINPLGGFATVEFDGNIIADKITVDEYNPTIMATACYPYSTKASPTVCVDPSPFDDRQEKVCHIGSQTLGTQGAPVAVTSIVQEAATDKIQFKITINNVGVGDVIKTGDSNNKEEDGTTVPTLDRCSPLSGGKLNRKDFDRVQVKKIKIGSVDLWNANKNLNKCSPFADGSNDIIKLFNGEGFVICTLTVSELGGGVQSAYTTPLNIELEYNYRSTISKPIKISKLTTIGDDDENEETVYPEEYTPDGAEWN